MLKSNWGEILKKQREKLGLTQEDIASLMNRTRNHIHNMESQKRPPKAYELGIYADAVGLDVSLLFESKLPVTALLLQVAQIEENIDLGELEKKSGIDFIRLSQADKGEISLTSEEIDRIQNLLSIDKSRLRSSQKASIRQILFLAKDLGLNSSDLNILKNFLEDRTVNKPGS